MQTNAFPSLPGQKWCDWGPGFIPWPANRPCPFYTGESRGPDIGTLNPTSPSNPANSLPIVGGVNEATNPSNYGIKSWDDLATKLGKLFNPNFWKGAGLIVVAGVLIIFGAMVWLQKSPTIRTAEKAAVA